MYGVAEYSFWKVQKQHWALEESREAEGYQQVSSETSGASL